MRRSVGVLALLFVLACRPAPPPPVAINADSLCAPVRDSLMAVADSLRMRLREQVILVGLAEQQMTRYATIVVRDPSQLRFLVGWTRRAFAGTAP